MSVGGPVIEPIEAFGANVAGENPEHGGLESQINQASTRRRYQRGTNATPPMVWFNIKSEEFPEAPDVRVASRRGGGETVDHTGLGRHDRVGMQRIRTPERVFLSTIFRTKLIEIFVGEKVAVGGLPRPHVNTRDCQGISRLGGTKEHG